jgi:hypothetical protein
MSCALCESSNQAEFISEMNIHFHGLRNIDKPGVLLFPTLLVCLDCGFSRFTTPKSELALLAEGTAGEGSTRHKSVDQDAFDQVGRRCRIAV